MKINEFTTGDGYRGNNDDNSISWERAKQVFKQFAEDSNALGYEEKNNGETVEIFWGPETSYPHDFFGLYVSPYGEHAIQGMLLGLLPEGKVDQLKKFILPLSMNGVDTAVRHYMALRT